MGKVPSSAHTYTHKTPPFPLHLPQIGVSSLAAGHKSLVPQLMEELKKQGAEHVMVVAGGVIPPQVSQGSMHTCTQALQVHGLGGSHGGRHGDVLVSTAHVAT